MINIIDGVHLLLLQESTKQDLGCELDIAQGLQEIKLLLNGMLVIEGRGNLILVSLKRD
jgi:hypothetical protein